MIIKSKAIIDCLNEIVEMHKSDGIEFDNIINQDTGEINENELSKIKYFGFQTNFESDEKLEKELEELASLLDTMKLKEFEIGICYSTDRQPRKTNFNLVNSLNEDIESIVIYGIDLSMQNSETFSKFNRLKRISLHNTNLSNLEIVSKLNSNVKLSIYDNPIEKNISEDTIRILKKYKSLINFSNGIVYDGVTGELKIKSTKDIDIDLLTKCTDIHKICLITLDIFSGNVFANHSDDSLYTREEFIKIKQEINNIIKQVKIPNSDDPDREKKIFAQVYKILGKKIKYNHYLLSNEANNEDVIKNGQNLLDGLTKNTCICAGYAQILGSVLNELGIKSEIIHEFPLDKIRFAFEALKYGGCNYNSLNEAQIEAISKVLMYDDRFGHAWNLVHLDNKAYLCDLTWDADNIRNGHFPLLNCCCSLQNFMERGHYKFSKTSYITDISEMSDEEQLRLFEFDEHEINKILNKSEENRGEQQIENCVQSVSTEIKSSDFEGLEEKLIVQEQTNDKRGEDNYDR